MATQLLLAGCWLPRPRALFNRPLLAAAAVAAARRGGARGGPGRGGPEPSGSGAEQRRVEREGGRRDVQAARGRREGRELSWEFDWGARGEMVGGWIN